MDTKSASPSPTSASASAAVLTRLDAITGTLTAARTAAAHGAQAPCGTPDWTVGTRDSCHPIPTFSASAGPLASRLASATTSSTDAPPGTRSAPEIRYTSAPSGSHRLAHRGGDRQREAHPPLAVTAPVVLALGSSPAP